MKTFGALGASPSSERIHAIIRRHQAGDPFALAELITANQGLIRRLASRWTSSAAPVEDLMQEGAMALLDCADAFREGTGATWGTFFGIAAWRKMSKYAKRVTAHRAMPFDEPSIPQTEWLDQLMTDTGRVDAACAAEDEQECRTDEYRAALHLIDRLPALERRAVYARFRLDTDEVPGMRTLPEVAAIIGVGQKRVKPLLSVAYELLRGMLADSEGPECRAA